MQQQKKFETAVAMKMNSSGQQHNSTAAAVAGMKITDPTN